MNRSLYFNYIVYIISILLYEEDDATYIVHIRKFFNLEHIPVHLFTNGVPSAENEYVLCQKLEDFFNNRMIPNSRSQFKEMLSELKIGRAHV